MPQTYYAHVQHNTYTMTHKITQTHLHTLTQNCQSITYTLKRPQTEKMKQFILNMYLLRHKHTLIYTHYNNDLQNDMHIQ